MGFPRMDPSEWETYTKRISTKPVAQLFTQRAMHDSLDPRTIAIRESCDSANNPQSTPIIVGVDHTGSLGRLSHVLVKTGLNTFAHEVYERKPVTDPHLMLMAVGDSYSDKAPLQVTQFETDIRLAEQLGNFYLEGNGGSNGGEMYSLVWYFAAMKTRCDSMMKRKKKGYLFTVGDEPVHPVLPAEHIRKFLNGEAEEDISIQDLYTLVNREWEVFHLVVTETRHGKMPNTLQSWRDILGERALPLDDHTKMAEVIISAIQLLEGVDSRAVANSWSGNTAVVVAKAVDSLSKSLVASNLAGSKIMYV
jgi:hypothetical protein